MKVSSAGKVSYILIYLAIVFGVWACDGSGKAKRREFVIAESKSYEASLFRQNCAICHGQEANGKEMDGRLIPSLRYGAAATKSEAEIYQQIKEGKLPMPSFKNQLTEDEIQRMVKFIRHDLQGKNDWERGRLVRLERVSAKTSLRLIRSLPKHY